MPFKQTPYTDFTLLMKLSQTDNNCGLYSHWSRRVSQQPNKLRLCATLMHNLTSEYRAHPTGGKCLQCPQGAGSKELYLLCGNLHPHLYQPTPHLLCGCCFLIYTGVRERKLDPCTPEWPAFCEKKIKTLKSVFQKSKRHWVVCVIGMGSKSWEKG